MFFKLKRNSLLLLGITSIVCARILFCLFNDPEGPNLLVVMGLALFLFLLSLLPYFLKFSLTEVRRFLLGIFIQIILIIGLYFFL
jgi:hypothetical protein